MWSEFSLILTEGCMHSGDVVFQNRQIHHQCRGIELLYWRANRLEQRTFHVGLLDETLSWIAVSRGPHTL
jgi:hypothetical protein